MISKLKISISSDQPIYVIKLNKREQQVIEYIINNDDIFNENFDVINTEHTREYVIIQKSVFTVSDCIKYFNHCFANDMIELSIRSEKIKKIQDVISTR
jgi:hypothetical protein